MNGSMRGEYCLYSIADHDMKQPGFVQDFDMQIQRVLKDCSRTKIELFKELQISIHSTFKILRSWTKTFHSVPAILTVPEIFLGLTLQNLELWG